MGELGERGIKMLCQLIQGNQGLRILHLNGQNLNEKTLTPLVEALNGHPGVQILDLYDCKITNDGAAFIVNNLKDNGKLNEINMGANDVDTERQIEIKEVTDQDKYK